MSTELIATYDPLWPQQFSALGGRLRQALAGTAQRIDHIGSTAVPGLAAKPVVDVQISVAELDDLERYRAAIEACGYVWRSDNPDLSKRYFREVPGNPRTHIHVRAAGSFDEQAALLFRDFLRSHPHEALSYAEVKRRYAHLLVGNRLQYAEAKSPHIWQLLRRADLWSQSTGWRPGPSDC